MLIVAEHYAGSDTGRQRRANEDSLLSRSPLFVVADGMGGAQAGEVASRIAVEAFQGGLPVGAEPELELADLAQQANARIHELSHSNSEQAGMGTTLTAVYVGELDIAIAHVGDSRAYLIDSGQCRQITIDHSYINELISNGMLTEDTARFADLEAMQSIITRAVGIASEVEPDIFTVDLHPGAAVLLTTDGLTRHVEDQEIAAVFAATEPALVCAQLIELANDRGGHDNITCLLLVCVPN